MSNGNCQPDHRIAINQTKKFNSEQYLEGKMDATEEFREKIEQFQKALSEINKYAKIIKLGSDRGDARFLEAEQIEKIIKETL